MLCRGSGFSMSGGAEPYAGITYFMCELRGVVD